MTATSTFAAREFKPFEKNTLRGFVSLELPSGLILHGFTLHEKNGSRWIGMPAKEFTKSDGIKSWVPQIEFASKEARDRFQAAALGAVDDYLEGQQR